jgi:hypothetical protein
MIYIFFAFKKYEKDEIFVFLMKTWFGKLLGFDYMYKNKTFFKQKIILKFLIFFLEFFNFFVMNVLEKT